MHEGFTWEITVEMFWKTEGKCSGEISEVLNEKFPFELIETFLEEFVIDPLI